MLKDQGERYLKEDEFIRHCRAFNIDISSAELEYYERKELLFPAVRILAPLDYQKLIFDINHNPQNPFFRKTYYEYPDEWQVIHDILQKLNFSFGIVRQSGKHFLDRINSSYIYDPMDTPHQPWEQYKKVVGKIGETDVKESIAVNLYHYWQIYQVHAIQKHLDASLKRVVLDAIHANKRKTSSKVGALKEMLQNLWRNRNASKSFDELIKERIGYIKIPITPPPVARGDYLGIRDLFEPLSMFSYFYKRKYTQALFKGVRKPDGTNEISDFTYKALERGYPRFVKAIIRKYALDHGKLLAYLKQLCARHDLLTKREERYKLATLLKADIADLIRFIEFGFDLDFKVIAGQVGRIGGYFENYLDIAFESAIEKTYKRGMPSVESFWEDFNKEIPAYFFDKTSLNELVVFLEAKNLEEFLYNVSKINENWFERDSMSSVTLLQALHGLAALPEKIISEMSLLNSGFTLATGATLKPCIDTLFIGEPWLNVLQGKWTLTRFGDVATGIQNLEDLVEKKHLLDVDTVHDLIVRTMIISGLVRNLTSHRKLKWQEVEKFYLRSVKSNIYFIFIIWFTAKKRGLM